MPYFSQGVEASNARRNASAEPIKIFFEGIILYTIYMKRLYRSDANKVFAGIFGGLGEYWDVDPTLLRLGFLLLAFVTGIIPGVLFYLVALMIVPRPPHHA